MRGCPVSARTALLCTLHSAAEISKRVIARTNEGTCTCTYSTVIQDVVAFALVFYKRQGEARKDAYDSIPEEDRDPDAEYLVQQNLQHGLYAATLNDPARAEPVTAPELPTRIDNAITQAFSCYPYVKLKYFLLLDKMVL